MPTEVTHAQVEGLVEPTNAPASAAPGASVDPDLNTPAGPAYVATSMLHQVGTFFSSVAQRTAALTTAQTSAVTISGTDTGLEPQASMSAASAAPAAIPSVRFKGKAPRLKTTHGVSSFNPYAKEEGQAQPEDVMRGIYRIIRDRAQTIVDTVTGHEHATSSAMVADPVDVPGPIPEAPSAGEASGSPSDTTLAVHTSPAVLEEQLEEQRVLKLLEQGILRSPHAEQPRERYGQLTALEISVDSRQIVGLTPNGTSPSQSNHPQGRAVSGTATPRFLSPTYSARGSVGSTDVDMSPDDSKDEPTHSKSDSNVQLQPFSTSSGLVTMTASVDSTSIVAVDALLSTSSHERSDNSMVSAMTHSISRQQNVVTHTALTTSKAATSSPPERQNASVRQVSPTTTPSTPPRPVNVPPTPMLSTPPRPINEFPTTMPSTSLHTVNSSDDEADVEVRTTPHKHKGKGKGKLPALEIDPNASNDTGSDSGGSTPVPPLPRKRDRQWPLRSPSATTAARPPRSGPGLSHARDDSPEEERDVLATPHRTSGANQAGSSRSVRGTTSSKVGGSNVASPPRKYGLGSESDSGSDSRSHSRSNEEDNGPFTSYGKSRAMEKGSQQRSPSDGVALLFAEHGPSTARPSRINETISAGPSAPTPHTTDIGIGYSNENVSDRAVRSLSVLYLEVAHPNQLARK